MLHIELLTLALPFMVACSGLLHNVMCVWCIVRESG